MTRDTWAQLPKAPHASNGEPYKMAQCTTSELARYRSELEQALAEIPADSPDHVTVETALKKVKDEQASRSTVGHR